MMSSMLRSAFFDFRKMYTGKNDRRKTIAKVMMYNITSGRPSQQWIASRAMGPYIPEIKQLTDDCPYRGDEQQQGHESDPSVCIPMFGCDGPTSANAKDDQTFEKGEHHSIAGIPDGIHTLVRSMSRTCP
jgi:hypothetical protein